MGTFTSAKTVEAWRAAGLGDELPALIEAHRLDLARIGARESDAADATMRARRERAAHVAEGRAGKMPALPEPADFDAARRVAGQWFARQLAELAELLVAQLAAAHERIVAEAVELVPLIGSLTTDEQALARQVSTESREAWHRLAVLWQQRKELLDMFGTLRRAVARCCPGDELLDARLPAERRDLQPFHLFAHPKRIKGDAMYLGAIFRSDAAPASLQMARLATDSPDTLPGVYTLAEAREHRKVRERELYAEAQAQQAQARPSRQVFQARSRR